ncbi:MAG TPA: enoyl-CoA hydratase/isomerase family protein [Mycobacteriales bacterium]|nr:enoyl-CoA hydratase/isomerase family protein [Mycobacteriales bacterium]
MSAPHATMSGSGGVLTVTIDRQDKLNAISPEVTAVLWEAVRSLAADPEQRVLVIRSVGRYFTAGLDIETLSAQRGQSGPATRQTYREHHLLYDEFEAVEKPIVIAAHAPCLGAGVEMALSCDFRLASDAARFQLPEINLAVVPGSGGISRLTRIVGPHWAKWLAMAGQSVDAREALQIGLVHAVYPASEFGARVDAFVDSLTKLPGEALGVAKLAIDMSANTDPGTARNIERIANTTLLQSDEHHARVAEFQQQSARRMGTDGNRTS